MISIARNVFLDESKIIYQAVRSSGPGGQHVNKVSTAIMLKYVVKFQDYPSWFLTQLKNNAGSLFSKNDEITIKAQSFRSQSRNKDDAFQRLFALFKQSAIRPKKRIKTIPSRSSNEKRISVKKKLSAKKNLRKPPILDD